MRAEADEDPAIEQLAAARDSDELCRLLVRSPWGWGSSTRHIEAVSLLRATHGRGTLPGSLVALLLCTCHRWDRVTAKLIAAIDDSGLLSSVELDELAESLLSDEVVAVFPLAWVSPEWLEFDTAESTTQTVKVSHDMVARDRRRLDPPLRRWAAARALRNDPGRLDGLLEDADGLPPRHRDALLHGLLDASTSLAAGQRRQLARRALGSGIARVRRAALDRLCELDGPEAALRRAAADADRTVRAWRPPGGPEPGQPPLPGMHLDGGPGARGTGRARTMSVVGRWRIVETELWDSDALNLVAPAFIDFGEDGLGSFGFIAVLGELDCREVIRDSRPGVEFSWEGNDECDPANGRGWAVLEEDDSLRGRIFFHLGDDSSFTAVRRGEPTQ